MFIASDRLECGIAGLEINMLATTQAINLYAKTYVICNVCETWNRYGLGRVQRIRHQHMRGTLQLLIEPGS